MMFNAGIIAFPQLSTGPSDPEWGFVTSLLPLDGDTVDDVGLTWTTNGAVPTDDHLLFGLPTYEFKSGGRVSTSAYSAYDFAAGDFTIECFVKDAGSGSSGSRYIVSNWTNRFVILWPSSTTIQFYINYGSVELTLEASYVFSNSEFEHIAVTRFGNHWSLFVDGKLLTLKIINRTIQSSEGDLYLGSSSDGSNAFGGYVGQFRLNKGLARYTPTIELPAAFPVGSGDPHFDDVSLLLQMNGDNDSTSFPDSSNNDLSVTVVGSTKIVTAQSVYGGSSGYFNGTDSRLTIAANGLFSFPADFTVEMWVRPETAPSGLDTLLNVGAYNNGIMFRPGDSLVYVNDVVVSNLPLVVGEWQHLAVVREGTRVIVFLAGKAIGIKYISGTVNSGPGAVWIADEPLAPGRFFDGWIDDFRITKGVARYSSDFTPATAPFPVG
jgi:hypothetical protein